MLGEFFRPLNPLSRRHALCEFLTETFLLRPTDARGANGFTTSRAHSMKILETGLCVRFFKLMIPTGQGGDRKSTGKTLRGGRCVPNRSKEPGIVWRNGPLASSAKNR